MCHYSGIPYAKISTVLMPLNSRTNYLGYLEMIRVSIFKVLKYWPVYLTYEEYKI
jgi:hypothetical protein